MLSPYPSMAIMVILRHYGDAIHLLLVRIFAQAGRQQRQRRTEFHHPSETKVTMHDFAAAADKRTRTVIANGTRREDSPARLSNTLFTTTRVVDAAHFRGVTRSQIPCGIAAGARGCIALPRVCPYNDVSAVTHPV